MRCVWSTISLPVALNFWDGRRCLQVICKGRCTRSGAGFLKTQQVLYQFVSQLCIYKGRRATGHSIFTGEKPTVKHTCITCLSRESVCLSAVSSDWLLLAVPLAFCDTNLALAGTTGEQVRLAVLAISRASRFLAAACWGPVCKQKHLLL